MGELELELELHTPCLFSRPGRRASYTVLYETNTTWLRSMAILNDAFRPLHQLTAMACAALTTITPTEIVNLCVTWID
jgi:hypothetical protein